MNSPRYKQGDKVQLAAAYPSVASCDGSLSSVFLASNGYVDESIEIAEVTPSGYIVELPSGYRLRISDRDIYHQTAVRA